MTIWQVVLLTLLWIPGFLVLWRVRTCPPRKPDELLPPFSVIIPARNEESRLPHLLSSLRTQTHAPEEILVVDDESTDGTAAVARAAGCRLIRVPKRPEGWLGKSWACWTGAREAKTDLFLFLDADTVLHPEGCLRILGEQRERGGLVSVQPWHRTGSVRERLSLFFNIVVMAALNSFTIFGKRLKASGSFGPCIVCGRADYFRVGGHESVKGSILEDIDLGRRFRDAGLEVSCRGGVGAISYRMYPGGIAEQVEGWGKNMAMGARGTHPRVLALTVCWITGCTAAFGLLVAGLVSFSPAGMVTVAVFYVAYVCQLFRLSRKVGNFGFPSCLAYPVPLGFFFFVLAKSVVSTYVLRRVSWKGRSIPRDAHERPLNKEKERKAKPRSVKL